MSAWIRIPWRTVTHCYEAGVSSNTHLKILTLLFVIHSTTSLCLNPGQQTRDAHRATVTYAGECVLNSTQRKAVTCRHTCILPHLHSRPRLSLFLLLFFYWSRQFHVWLLEGVLGRRAKAKPGHIFYIAVAMPVGNAKAKNALLTSARLPQHYSHAANIVSKLPFWLEHEVICLCSTLRFVHHSCALSSCLQNELFSASFSHSAKKLCRFIDN